MKKPTHFKTITGQRLPLPIFFPDATRAVLRTLDSQDIQNTHTPGILVNTYHLTQSPGLSTIKSHRGIRPFMNWSGVIISDSGGFQVMSIAKQNPKRNPITNQGVTFHPPGSKKILLTPELSIRIQLALKTDLIVVLDDFTPPQSSPKVAKKTVKRTLNWAHRSKKEFEKLTKDTPSAKKPYLIGVVQGGSFPDLRESCTQELVKIGFDGLGYGGWPLHQGGSFDYQSAKIIKKNSPDHYLLYGLGIGKPDQIAALVKQGWHIFDCVLPTRDARHQRLYVYTADSIKNIDPAKPQFYSYLDPTKEKYYRDFSPVSTACDCLLCKNYTRSYLHHLFKIKETTAQRLATIHNLRFYSLLMEKLQS
jgi:queuine tRNA-ribosyltransferase